MVDCKVCKHRFRADHLPDRSQCPDCGSKDSFTEPRNFNLMMQTSVGPMEDTSAVAYLRPETAQGIFVNFKNIYQTARKRPPFGIAQIGKSFRNEITPGNFTFRLREFEQAELEYFVPDDGKDMDAFREWVERRKAWYANYGIAAGAPALLRADRSRAPALRQGRHRRRVPLSVGLGRARVDRAPRHLRPRRAHEALGQGPALLRRGEQDALHAAPHRELGRHGPHDAHVADRRLRARDAASTPTARRPSAPSCASIRASRPSRSRCFRWRATSPSWSSARERSRRRCGRTFRTQYDEGNIGQLYRRQDEIGTPFCVTVDYETLGDGSGNGARRATRCSRSASPRHRSPSTCGRAASDDASRRQRSTSTSSTRASRFASRPSRPR